MTTPRDLSLTPREQDLKAASRELIEAYGGQQSASALLGPAQSRYSDAGHNNTRVFLRIDEVVALEDRTAGRTGHPHVTRELARRQGYSLAPLPNALPAPMDLLQCLGVMAHEAGDVMTSISAALVDRKFTKKEAKHSIGEIDELMQVLVTMRAGLELVVEGGE